MLVALFLLSYLAVPVSRSFVAAALASGSLAALICAVQSAGAAQRTLLLAPADLVTMVDDFNAAVLARSGSLGRTVAIRHGAVTLAGTTCPSLSVDIGRVLTRVRLLDGPARAAALARKRAPRADLDAALTSMGAARWSPPSAARTRQPLWLPDAGQEGVVGFVAAYYPNGDRTGAIDSSGSADSTARFLLNIDLAASPATEGIPLVFALTTEAPSQHAGQPAKQTECFLVWPIKTADLQTLVDLVSGASLTDATREKLSTFLADALSLVAADRTALAVRALYLFGAEVAYRSADEIPPDTAQALITRALAVIEALTF